MITPEQCRAARALLRMSQDDLAAKTKLSAVTIRKFENQTASLREATINLIELTRASSSSAKTVAVLVYDCGGD